MEAICADAAQFFKIQKIHAIERSDELFRQLKRKMANATVAVANTNKSKGYIVKDPKFVPKGYKSISFDDIKGALKFAVSDRYFC